MKFLNVNSYFLKLTDEVRKLSKNYQLLYVKSNDKICLMKVKFDSTVYSSKHNNHCISPRQLCRVFLKYTRGDRE